MDHRIRYVCRVPGEVPRPPVAYIGPVDQIVRITLVGKAGCHLCDDARAVIKSVIDDCPAGAVVLEERDINDDVALRAAYAEEIPVTLVDGEQHDFWRVDAARLRAAIDAKAGKTVAGEGETDAGGGAGGTVEAGAHDGSRAARAARRGGATLAKFRRRRADR